MGEGKGWTAVQAIGALSYPYFEHLVWKAFGARLAAAEFDLVHRVTPLSPTVPSPIAARCRRIGVPFVVGPLNGGVPWPPGFEPSAGASANGCPMCAAPTGCCRDAPRPSASDAVIVGSRHTESEIPSRFRTRCFYIPENGVDPSRFSRRARHRAGPLRACFIGRMVPYKGPDMLLDAALAAAARRPDDARDDRRRPDARRACRAQAAAAGVDGAVRFHGWLPHDGGAGRRRRTARR